MTKEQRNRIRATIIGLKIKLAESYMVYEHENVLIELAEEIQYLEKSLK